MLIVCPSCSASYSLTEEQLGRGRTLRCAQCRHTWFASPDASALPLVPQSDAAPVEGPAEGPVASVTPDDDPTPRKKAPRPAKARTVRPPIAHRIKAVPPWLAACAALLVVLGAAVVQRKAVVRAAPQTARLFAAIGLPVNLRGLAFDDVRSQLLLEGEQAALIVEGEIHNLAHGETPVPPVRLSLRNADGREIYAWTAEPQRQMLAVGEAAPFRTRLVAPPLDGRDVLVRFSQNETGAPPAH